MLEQFEALLPQLRQKLESIPPTLAQDSSARQIITNAFYNLAEANRWLALPAWKPPKSSRENLDLVAFDLTGELPKAMLALVADPLVELPRVRALEWLECKYKIYVTYSPRADKVKPTTFFLQADNLHLNIFS